MALPTFVNSVESNVWDESAGVRTAAITVQTGDRLIILGATEDNAVTVTITNAGGQTWTAITGSPSNVASHCKVYGWTATSVTTGSITIELTRGAGGVAAGFEVYAFRDSDGFDNVTVTSGSSDDPSFSLTTTQANSAIAYIRADWNASDTGAGGATPATYRTASAGAFSERSFYRNSARYTTANGYHADAGTAAAKTLGHTTTGTVTEAWVVAAVGVKGTAAAASLPILVMAPPIPA